MNDRRRVERMIPGRLMWAVVRQWEELEGHGEVAALFAAAHTLRECGVAVLEV